MIDLISFPELLHLTEAKLSQNDSNGKCIERIEGHYLEVVVEVYK